MLLRPESTQWEACWTLAATVDGIIDARVATSLARLPNTPPRRKVFTFELKM